MAVGFIQGTGQTASGWVTSVARAFVSSVTAGNAIIVGIALSAITDKVSGVSDSLGNTYTRRIRTINDDLTTTYIYEALNITGGACTVTVSLSSGEYIAIGIAEASGLPTTAAIDVSNGAYGNNAAAQVGLTTTDSDIIFGVMSPQASGTITPNTGYTQIYEQESYNDMTISFVYRIGSAGAYTVGWTNPNNRWCCSAAAYKPAAGGGGNAKIPYALKPTLIM